MFREIILPIFRSTRLCITACDIMDPRCCRPPAGRQHRGCIIPQAVTQSSAPEDWQNNYPKNVELTGIINKPLLLHLVGCLYYLYFNFFLDLLNKVFSELFAQLYGKCQGYTRKEGARPALLQISCYLCCSVVICAVLLLLCCTVVICVVLLLFVLFYVLFVCKCVLYHCHHVFTQLHLKNI